MMSFYQFNQAGNIYSGCNETYDIKIYSPGGKHIQTIEKEFDRRKVTQQDIDEMIAGTPDIAPGLNDKEAVCLSRILSVFPVICAGQTGTVIRPNLH
jgi:hypothetical protein